LTRRPAPLVSVSALVLAAACSADVSFEGTRYQCPDGRCPSGQTCVAGFCEEVPGGGDGPGPGRADAGVPGELLSVGPGSFMMGCAIAVDPTCPLDAIPPRTVTLSAFQIERTEVTRGAFRDCVSAGPCPDLAAAALGDARAPMTDVPWSAAVAYCAWLGRKLPTEAQWERSARGPDGRTYPWGNAPEPTCARATFAGCGGPTAVGTRSGDASPIQARDMAGNAAEWVADWYAPVYVGDTQDPTGPVAGQEKVMRGGGHSDAVSALETFARAKADPATVSANVGFRCAK
jgi:formylglycine-generating enzyme required for sulfatase activity